MQDELNVSHICWHEHPIVREDRERLNHHRGAVLWFTGLSGSGKSTLAGVMEQQLYQQGIRTYLLDGDNVRHGLCRDLSFSDADRRENIRRVGEVVGLMVDAGLLVLSAFISPHREERARVRACLPQGRFIEIFVDTSLTVCESRDPKGLYRLARAGEIAHFTGIAGEYEVPLKPEIRVDGDLPVIDTVTRLMDFLISKAIISS